MAISLGAALSADTAAKLNAIATASQFGELRGEPKPGAALTARSRPEQLANTIAKQPAPGFSELKRQAERQSAEAKRQAAEAKRKAAWERHQNDLDAQALRTRTDSYVTKFSPEVQPKVNPAKIQLLAQLKAEINYRFLTSAKWFAAHNVDNLVSDAEYHELLVASITKWCRNNLAAFEPTAEQALAIAAVDNHTLVAARAGSGKTTTMVNRSIFLIKQCGIPVETIMMLAFNNKAARKIQKDLASALPGKSLPHVMTFHALANRIVYPTEDLLYDDEAHSQPAHSTYLQAVRDNLMAEPEFYNQVKSVMLQYFKQDWQQFFEPQKQLIPAEFVQQKLLLQQESLKGDRVKSGGEKIIANILFQNGICGNAKDSEYYYEYEPRIEWNGHSYRPDFVVYEPPASASGDQKKIVAIEYFGMQGNLEYDQISALKREYWQSEGVELLEYYPDDVKDPEFETRLLTDLASLGIPLAKLTEAEIWERIKTKAIDRFTKTVKTVVNRARQRGWTGTELHAAWVEMDNAEPGVTRFIGLAAQILDAYLAKLGEDNLEDFAGLMWRAVAALKSGTTSFGSAGKIDGDLRDIKYLVVDEFQDFSQMFAELTSEILQIAPAAQVTAIGDDWQAINEFAGSSLTYFNNFADTFTNAVRLELTENRRSAAQIVNLGNQVMNGLGALARHLPGHTDNLRVREFNLNGFEPTNAERTVFGKTNQLEAALARLIQQHLNHGRTVAVLSRRSNGYWTVYREGGRRTATDFADYGGYFKKMLRQANDQNLRFSTTHSFKGEEADAVILLDVDAKNYPLIHPAWPLTQVFGDNLNTLTEAERRLFYVAVSRPKSHLDVIVNGVMPSPFWEQVRPSESPAWTAVPPVQYNATSYISNPNQQVYVTAGGSKYHQTPSCEWLLEGQRKALAEGQKNHPVIPTLRKQTDRRPCNSCI